MVALAAILRGRRARGANALRITTAIGVAVLIRIAGYGVQGMAIRNPAYCVLYYLIPLLGGGLALANLAGVDPRAWFRRAVPAEAMP
jgi:lipopolysaccharide export system permease protein